MITQVTDNNLKKKKKSKNLKEKSKKKKATRTKKISTLKKRQLYCELKDLKEYI